MKLVHSGSLSFVRNSTVRSCFMVGLFVLPAICYAELGGVATESSHLRPIGIRDTPVPIDDPDTGSTVRAGIKFVRDHALKGCGSNPYAKGMGSICHPRHATYVRVGDVLTEVLTKANIMPGDSEFERYRLTIVLEAARSGMEHVTAMAVSEDRKTHGASWVQLEQHYSSSIDDPRTMSVYVDVQRTQGISNSRIREAIDYVDAYRRGVFSRYKLIAGPHQAADPATEDVAGPQLPSITVTDV